MTIQHYTPIARPRRIRLQPNLRHLVRETQLSVNDFVLPLFIKEGIQNKEAIASMPGHYQLGLNDLDDEIKSIKSLGIKAVMLFGIPKYKDPRGSSALSDSGIVQQATARIKALASELTVMVDVCMCEYTDHGHCGTVEQTPYGMEVANDETLTLLCEQSISLIQAGADVIAPSGMMDGMVGALRSFLDGAGHSATPILSYAVKYCSALYGPFREAAEGAPQFGNRQSYQVDPANANEALREAALDVQEHADMLMVKPATNYLDIIYRIKSAHPEIPLAAYHVSGEYAMVKAAAKLGWLDERATMVEVLTSIKRAGADFIINYACKEVADYLGTD